MSIETVDRAIDESFKDLQGWCTPDKGKRMARLVADLGKGGPVHCVELGVFGGRGVIAMGLAIKHMLGGGGAVYGIDPFTAGAALEGTNEKANQDWWAKLDYEAILRGTREGIRKAGFDALITLVIARSQDVVGTYADKSIDLLHQDSNHSEEVSCYEVGSWTPKCKPGAYWVFDDTNWPSTKLAQKRLVEQHGFALVEQFDSWAIFRAPA
jgi:hypothetical protein